MFSSKLSVFDGIVIAVILALAVLLFFRPFQAQADGASLLVVTPEGSSQYDLSVDRVFALTSRGVTLTVEIFDGRARVSESDCPDRICVSGGWIAKSGETVVCAPAGVRLTVLAEGGTENVDFIAG